MLDDTIKEFNSIFEGLKQHNWKPQPPNFENRISELNFKYLSNNRETTELLLKTVENIKKTLYGLNNQNSQIAFIKEIITLFHEYENLFDNDENTEIIDEVWNYERHDFSGETIPDYFKYVSDLYHLYNSFMMDIRELCFLFSIDLDTLINEHKKRWELPPTPPIIWKNASEITDTEPEPTQQGTPNPLTPPKQTTFKSLFIAPYCFDTKITELKKILETNEYTVKEQWRGKTGNKNELAQLYHYLKSNPGIIARGHFKQQIAVFYKEFGLIVKDKLELEQGVYCVIKNLQKYSEKTDTYKDFERLFIQWVQ